MVRVRFDRHIGNPAEAGLGRGAVAGRVTHHQVRAEAGERTVKGLMLEADILDDVGVIRILPIQQAGLQLGQQGFDLIWPDTALSFSPAHVEIDTVQANGIGLCRAPVHAAQVAPAVLQAEILVIRQPAVQMDLFARIAKAVVGEDQVAVFAAPRLHLGADGAHEFVQQLIPAVDDIHTVMEEHVLDAVEIVEDAGQHALTKVGHQVAEDADALVENHGTQTDELVVADAVFLQGGRILRPAQGQVWADVLP